MPRPCALGGPRKVAPRPILPLPRCPCSQRAAAPASAGLPGCPVSALGPGHSSGRGPGDGVGQHNKTPCPLLGVPSTQTPHLVEVLVTYSQKWRWGVCRDPKSKEKEQMPC